MATVVDLTDQEVAELKEATNQADVATAVRTAITEYLRYVRRMRLNELSGQVEVRNNWAELERAEVKSDHENPSSEIASLDLHVPMSGKNYQALVNALTRMKDSLVAADAGHEVDSAHVTKTP